MELDMSPFLSFGGADWRAVGQDNASKSPSSPSSSTSSSSSMLKRSSANMYDLCAVIEHYGGAIGGHYATFRRVLLDESTKQVTWFYASDMDVQPTTEARVLGCEAYLLFYERRNV
jgi:ubiquitin C-terminal hydrolase